MSINFCCQTYEEVCSGRTGHTEAVLIEFNPSIVSYSDLLTVFWDRIDPTTRNSQGNDFGTQYRSGIYYHNDDQRKIAESSLRQEQLKHQRSIVTEIEKLSVFYPAEEYHQQYLSKGGQCSRKGDLTDIRCYG
jgi:peptide-methionine (S)-S-oxide reductase